MEPAFLDLEGTEDGKVISIGAVYKDKTFYTLVHPNSLDRISPRITELTGITPDMVKDQPLFHEVFPRLMAWLPEKTPVYVWGCFDGEMLRKTNEELTDNFRRKRLQNAQNTLSRFLLPKKEPVGLQKAADILGIKVKQSHNALDDAILLKQIFESLSAKSNDELMSMLKKNFPDMREDKLHMMLANGLRTLGKK